MIASAKYGPNWYPSSFYQYMKHPHSVIRIIILAALMVVAAAFSPMLELLIPSVLVVIFLVTQFYHYKNLYPKRTVTRTFGELVAEMEEAPKLPLVTTHYKLEVEPGRGIVISGSEGVVVSPNVSVSLQADGSVYPNPVSPRLQQDDYARANAEPEVNGVYVSRVGSWDVDGGVEDEPDTDLSDVEIARVTQASVTAACNLLTEADYAEIEAAYRSMPVGLFDKQYDERLAAAGLWDNEPSAAADFNAMSYDGILENGTGGPKSVLGRKFGLEITEWPYRSVMEVREQMAEMQRRLEDSMGVPASLMGSEDKIAEEMAADSLRPNWTLTAENVKGWADFRATVERDASYYDFSAPNWKTPVITPTATPVPEQRVPTPPEETRPLPITVPPHTWHGILNRREEDLPKQPQRLDTPVVMPSSLGIKLPPLKSNDWSIQAHEDGGFSVVRPEVEGKEIILTPREFHKAGCTPETCVCTSKGFFAAVEATKADEVVTFPANSPRVKMPSALYSRAVERQLEVGKLRLAPDGAVRAVRDRNAPVPARRSTSMPYLSDVRVTKDAMQVFDGPVMPAPAKKVLDYVPSASRPLDDTGQKLLLEMLKVIPADLLEPDTTPVVTKPKRNVDVVRDLMEGGRWWTLDSLSKETGFPEASVSARMRDLRKPGFGGHTIERKYDTNWGLYKYRMTA